MKPTSLYTPALQRELQAVERYLQHVVMPPAACAEEDSVLGEAGRYLINSGGKRLRAALLILCAQLCECYNADSIKLAAAVELLHTATLVHDDLLDQSHLRRGRPTVHCKWDSKIALLVGDHLFLKTISLLLESPEYPTEKRIALPQLVMRIASQMFRGEVEQYKQRANLGINLRQYLSIIKKKTAVLLAMCCQLGPFLHVGLEEESEILRQFGHDLGIGFQIIDDTLDIFGEECKLGKAVGSDIRQQRITLPFIHFFHQADAASQARMRTLIDTRPLPLEEIKQLLHQQQAQQYSLSKAQQYLDKARKKLDYFRPCAAKNNLLKICDFVINRCH